MGLRWGYLGGILLVYGVCVADGCRQTLQDLGFNARQQEALRQSAGAQHKEYLRGTVNGKKKTVLLIGEVHTQDAYEAASGKALVDAFPDRSVEGWPGSPFWKATITFAYFLDGLSRGKRAGSNLTYAGRQAKTPGTDHRRMEADYRPTWKERMYSWIVPSVYITDKLWWTPSLGMFLSFDIQHMERMLLWPAAAVATLAVTTMAKEPIMEQASAVMRPGRDAHMSASIIKRLNEENGPEILMVLVGRSHLSGIREGLKKAGFETVYPKYGK